ncbi:unnamed protein product [Fraxinus pennsylvanica]|uniref:Peroxidase n=1 Tax=Fraxinus pennsylvanica TaxID=56036 RepID=A0AAD1ZCX8_9LAMI|nr:unnamed protein product [Fraxinus pennsylvanica]
MNVKISKVAAVALLFSLVVFSLSKPALAKPENARPAKVAPLKVGFYAKTCPLAEKVVRNAVNKAVSLNPGMAAGLIRMHFHDCFVRGCDGSVLLDSVPGKPVAEKDNLANNPSLRGFEVIDQAKFTIETICPRTVSCADILAFAARDSALKAGNIWYEVPAGRRDGLVSLSSEVLQELPPPFFNAEQLQDNFKRKGLSLDEMITLSGAHSIGVSHCSSFSNRLYSFNATHPQDPSLDSAYAAFLKARCPPPANNTVDTIVNLDIQTPTRLDYKYYTNLQSHRGLFTSDQTLLDSPLTRKLVVNNVMYGNSWAKKFGAAMVRMGSIDVLAGKQGEIRKNCRFVN